MLQQNAKTCPGFSAIWLIIVNIIYMIFGIIFMSLASWGIQQQSQGGATQCAWVGSRELEVMRWERP